MTHFILASGLVGTIFSVSHGCWGHWGLQAATRQLFTTSKHHFQHDALVPSHHGTCSPIRNLNVQEYISSMELMYGCA